MTKTATLFGVPIPRIPAVARRPYDPADNSNPEFLEWVETKLAFTVAAKSAGASYHKIAAVLTKAGAPTHRSSLSRLTRDHLSQLGLPHRLILHSTAGNDETRAIEFIQQILARLHSTGAQRVEQFTKHLKAEYEDPALQAGKLIDKILEELPEKVRPHVIELVQQRLLAD